MIALDLSLGAQTERYLLSHSCCDQYAKQLRKRAEHLAGFAGGHLSISSVTCELVNEWLVELAKQKKPSTVDGYRRAILAVWNDAYLSGLTDEPPLRIRKIRVSATVVSAYSIDEIRQLISAAKTLPGRFRNGLPRCLFWEAAIRVAYESGLRRGDCLAMQWESIGRGNRWTVIQSKTGYIHCGKFTDETMKVLAKIPRPDGRVLPFPLTIRYFGGGFKTVRKLASITRGTFKWLRRSAGSYAEQFRRGDGPRMLGHRDSRVFQRHYEDQSITQSNPIQPPPL